MFVKRVLLFIMRGQQSGEDVLCAPSPAAPFFLTRSLDSAPIPSTHVPPFWKSGRAVINTPYNDGRTRNRGARRDRQEQVLYVHGEMGELA